MAGFNVRSIFGKRSAGADSSTHEVKDQVLFVCTGNIARSASAELIAKHQAAESGWIFASAGTGAMTGHGVAEHLDTLLTDRGISVVAHQGQQITEKLVAESALVLVMEREHLDWLVAEWPQYRAKIHLLKQMSRLSATAGKRVDPISFMALTTDFPLKEDDIADPYRRGAAAARLAFEEIEGSLQKILPWLGTVRSK